MQLELQILRMENVRLTNELVKRNEYVCFLEDENRAIEEETRNEYEAKLAFVKKERDNALGKVTEAESEAKTAKAKAEKEKMRADNAEQMLDEARKALEESNKRISVLSKKVKTIDDLREVAGAADKAALDAKQVVELIKRRVFQRNSDATRFLNGEVDPNCPLLEENGLAAIVKHVMAVTSGKIAQEWMTLQRRKQIDQRFEFRNKRPTRPSLFGYRVKHSSSPSCIYGNHLGRNGY